MKKKILTVLALMVLSLISLVACSSKPSVSGEFKNDTYVLSISESINFYDELNLKIGDKNSVEIVFSNKDLVSSEDNKNFVAKSSGETIVFARYNNKNFASCKLIIKYQFSLPTNIRVDEEGLLSWDISRAIVKGEEISSTNYKILIANITDLLEIDYDNLIFEEIIVQDYYQLSEKGCYYVKLQALEDEKNYIDASSLTDGQVINYGVMGKLENLTVIPVEKRDNFNATITWQDKENAYYNVFIEGFLIYENLVGNQFSYNFSSINNEDSVSVEVIAFDSNNEKLSTSTYFHLTVLDNIIPVYNSVEEQNKDGYISWDNIDNAERYLFTFIDNSTGEEFNLVKNKENYNFEVFDGLPSGGYTLVVNSLGGVSGNNLYLTSHSSGAYDFAKLNTPNAKVVLDGNKAIINIVEDFYNTNYKVSFSDKVLYFDKNEFEIDLSGLEVGEYNLSIIALPVEDRPFIYEEVQYENILNSNPFNFQFFVLDELSEVDHNYYEQENRSVFTILEIANANYYEIYVNEDLVEDAEILIQNSVVYITIYNLKDFIPQDNIYNIKIIAGNRDEFKVEHAILSQKYKTLEILPVVLQSSQQENGYYSWENLEEKYNGFYQIYYEIFKADKNYFINSDVIQSGYTMNGVIENKLDFGYYVIKVYSISNLTNKFLNCNFHDNNNCLIGNFFVTIQNDTPSAVLIKENDNFYLEISTVEYGGGYNVYIDDNLDGSIEVNNDSAKATYRFANGFEQSKNYNIKIVATSGSKYDGQIHLDSTPYEMFIERLAMPRFVVQESFDSLGIKNHEWLQVQNIENTEEIIVKIDQQLVALDDQNKIDIYSYDNDFNISLQFISKANEENQYYLNSLIRTVNINRVEAPSNMQFYDGIVSWNVQDANIENYYITIILTNSQNGNYYSSFWSNNTQNYFNLQELVNDLLINDISFATHYRIAESVNVKIYSFVQDNDLGGGEFNISSLYGQTMTGKDEIILTQLQSPLLTFNSDTKILQWNQVADETKYDIYIDNIAVLENYTECSISLDKIKSVDWSLQKEVFVRSVNPNYLDSQDSNVLFIKQIAPVSSVNVGKYQDKYIVSFNFINDISNIENVFVNGSTDNVSYTAGSNSGYFFIEDYIVNDFEIQVIAKDNGNNYYLDSNKVSYNLSNLANETFMLTQVGDILSWDRLAVDCEGQSKYPVNYMLYIMNEDKTYNISVNGNEFSIQEIEEQIGIVLSSEVKIYVKASTIDYSLTTQNDFAKGYYGEIISNEISIKKIDAINDLSYKILQDEKSVSQIDKYLNSYAIVSWQDIWTDLVDIKFEITITSKQSEVLTFTTGQGESENYSLILDKNTYNLTLKKSLLTSEISNVSIKVISLGSISSESAEIILNRYQTIIDASIDNNGLLNINFENSIANNSDIYFQLTIGGTYTTDYVFTADQLPLNLNDYDNLLKGRYGEYSIKILLVDEDGTENILPSYNSFNLTGRKLQGVENLHINDSGNIIITVFNEDLTNIIFYAKAIINGEEVVKEFVPNLQSEQTNIFEISMIDFLQIFYNEKDLTLNYLKENNYEFEITVGKNNSVTADWANFDFNYKTDNSAIIKRSGDFSQDYIIFDILNENVLNDITVTFSIEIIYQDQMIREYKTAVATRGYWKTTSQNDKGTFVTTLGDDQSEEILYSACYAINLKELLSNIDYGIIQINISRIGYDSTNENYYQFTEYNFVIKKLNTVQLDVSFKNNILSWSWIKPEDFVDETTFTPYSYYVVIREIIEGEENKLVTKLQVNTESIDLKNVLDIIPGKQYNISIIALPSITETLVLASNEVAYTGLIYKFETPSSLQITEGKITFDADKFKTNNEFINYLNDYFGVTKNSENKPVLYELLGTNNNFINPITFTSSNLSSQYIKIKFTLRKDGSDTSVVYQTDIIPAYHLFPDVTIYNMDSDYAQINREISYFDLLKTYLNLNLSNVSGNSAENTKSLINTLMKSSRGISGDSILFNDFGVSIPAGEYSVSVYQTSPNSLNVIDSKVSESIIMYVNPSPSVELQKNNRTEEGSLGNKNYYEVKVTNIPLYLYNEESSSYIQELATEFKLIMRFNYESDIHKYEDNEYIEFDIRYISGNWAIFYDNEEINDIIHDSTINNFTINFTNLRDYLLNYGFDNITNKSIRVDLYAFTNDEGNLITNVSSQSGQIIYGSINGKNTSINLTFLDLNDNNIFIEEGNLGINFDSGENNSDSILVKYFTTASGEQNKIVQIGTNSTVYLDFDYSGEYKYIVLSINGTISNNTMRVESQSYAILNTYKLSTPLLSTSQNNLYVALTSTDISKSDLLTYKLANNLTIDEENGYYYTSPQITTTYLLHQFGYSEEYYENEAQQFYVYLLGNTGKFISIKEENISGSDNLLIFNGDKESYPILSSNESIINAEMLKDLQKNPIVYNGNIMWESSSIDNLKEGTQLLYQVDIKYYDLVQDGSSRRYEFILSETYYTTSTTLNYSYIDNTYNYYIISVTALAGTITNEQATNKVKTIEENYYNITNSVFYENGSNVLRGQVVSVGEEKENGFVTRTDPAILTENMTGISGNSIEFLIKASVYNNNPNDNNTILELEKNLSTSSRIEIISKYVDEKLVEHTEILSGSFNFSEYTGIDAIGYVKVTFTLDEGQLEIPYAISIEIRNYIYSEENSLLMSNPLIINNVYKLTDISENYYSIVLQKDGNQYKTYIDFSNYFNQVSVSRDNTCYKLIIEAQNKISEEILTFEFTSSNESKLFELSEEYSLIKVQVVDNQSSTQGNRKLILSSDIKIFEIENTEVKDENNEWLKISWDSQYCIFTWQWDEDHNDLNNNSYQYYVSINQGGNIINEITTNNYYMPQQGGNINIQSFSVRARLISNQLENKIYIFSEQINYNLDQGPINYTLFAGGKGTESSPYLISNAEQFLEIYKRNREGTTIYYKLISDIILGDNFLIQLEKEEIDFRKFTFYGVLDGKNNSTTYTLTLNVSDYLVTEEPYNVSLNGYNADFNNFFALFENIDSSAIIKNLNIDLNISINSLNNTNLLISPLALYNAGTIQNVNVQNVTFDNLSGSGSNAVFVGGIACVNYGLIKNCENNSTFTFEMKQNLSLRFAYAGITLFNATNLQSSGEIQNSFNYGNKSIRVAQNNNISYLSGITLVNSGYIVRSGNDGNFDVYTISSITAFTSYQTGVTIISNFGTIEYCYNNGLMTKSSSVGSLYRSGITYSITGGTINYLAETQGYALISNAPQPPTDHGKNYAVSNSGTSASINTINLSVLNPINAGEEYYFSIISIEDGFLAQITHN